MKQNDYPSFKTSHHYAIPLSKYQRFFVLALSVFLSACNSGNQTEKLESHTSDSIGFAIESNHSDTLEGVWKTSTDSVSQGDEWADFEEETLSVDDNLQLVMTPDFDFSEYDRKSIIEKLQRKIDASSPLIAHIFVPLCDNEHQGIVPVNASLGNGLNLKTNLYWGAAYGIKTHFKRLKDWQFIESKFDINSLVLERSIFAKKFSNGAQVYLVADAYRGDKMKATIEIYLESVAGGKKDMVAVNHDDGTADSLGIYGNADLLGFNGHNGLMDNAVEFAENKDGRIIKDAVVIACSSGVHFNDYLNYAGGYPLVTTTNLLAPEAYVMEGILTSWALMKPAEEIRLSAGNAYHNIQKCGLRGARRLFKTGW